MSGAMDGLIGKKIGMMQVYDANGVRKGVTVIEAGPCVVVQRKTGDKDGYEAVQVGFQDKKESKSIKSELARFKKAGMTPKRFIKEFAVDSKNELKAGDTVNATVFEGVKFVDVTGITKGRGFQGVVKRYRMRGGPMTHGGHSKRRVGSIGQNSYPARVLRGKRMPGHMGVDQVTVQNLEVVELRGQENLILVSGAVPGANGCVVIIKKALKKKAGKA
jgi:large subunit ribosomal protein L3